MRARLVRAHKIGYKITKKNQYMQMHIYKKSAEALLLYDFRQFFYINVYFFIHFFGLIFVPSGKTGLVSTFTHFGLPFDESCDLYS